MAETAAHALLRALHEAGGADVVFANPGTTEMSVVAALDKLPNIRPVLCLHENVATGAADGFGRMARRPALVLLHLGPGLANGLANLHNARRARSPVVALVGAMASWHEPADPVLNMDIRALAATVSACVLQLRVAEGPSDAYDASSSPHPAPTDLAPAPAGAGASGPGVHGPVEGLAFALSSSRRRESREGSSGEPPLLEDGRVVTIVVPHDASWGPADRAPIELVARAALRVAGPLPGPPLSPGPVLGATDGGPVGPGPELGCGGSDGLRRFLRSLAEAWRREAQAGGRVALFLGGAALVSEDALLWAGRIGAFMKAALLCEGAFARLERGCGLPHLQRLPYFPQEAQQELQRYGLLVVVDARLPVANFGYRGGPSALVPERLTLEDRVWELDGQAANLAGDAWPAEALALLALELGVGERSVAPGVNCGGVFPGAGSRPRAPAAGRLTAQGVCQGLAAAQPEGCILVDESLTSGGSYWDLAKGCPRFTHLTLTGGAIGIGPAMSVGAAVACPDRLVINLQADGSAMYTLQALWTQAREKLNVITVICDNSSYAILKVECARQRLPAAGSATRALTSLGQPSLDWVSLAQGMGVRAVRVATAEAFQEALVAAVAERASGSGSSRPGPMLIQAHIPGM